MKPKTKFEKRIAARMNRMPKLPKSVEKWAYKEFITPVGFTSSSRKCHCGFCGKAFTPTEEEGREIERIIQPRKHPCKFCTKPVCYRRAQVFREECKEFRRHKENKEVITIKCPHCKKTLAVCPSFKRKETREVYFAIIMPVDGIQTQRNIKFYFEFVLGKPMNVVQKDWFDVWISETGIKRITRVKFGEKEVGADGKKLMSLQADYCSRFRHPCHVPFIGRFFLPAIIYPKAQFADYVKIRGIERIPLSDLHAYRQHDSGIFGVSPSSFEFMKVLVKYPFVETLVKQGDIETLHIFFSHSLKTILTIIPAYNIIKRHNYKPSDLNLWIDMVMIYHYAGKDIRNPRFICPENMEKGHEEALEMAEEMRAIQQRRWNENYERTRPRDVFWFLDHHPEELVKVHEDINYLNELNEIYGGMDPRVRYFTEYFDNECTGTRDLILRQELISNDQLTPEIENKVETNFKKLKSRFFNIEFGDDELSIVSLDSIEAYRIEGQTMRNCVETNSYFLKPDSLILSVRKDGKPMADVEISLLSFKVMQCYGPCNRRSPYLSKIKKLISDNIDIIKGRLS